MRIDFTKLWSYIQLKKLPIALFFCSIYLPIAFHIGYIFTTKEYHFLLYDFIIGLGFYMVYDFVLGEKLGIKKKKKKRRKPKVRLL